MRQRDGSFVSIFEESDDLAVIGGDMRKCAVFAVLDTCIGDGVVSGTVHVVERAVAKKAVQVLVHIMTGVEPAILIGKK